MIDASISKAHQMMRDGCRYILIAIDDDSTTGCFYSHKMESKDAIQLLNNLIEEHRPRLEQ